MGDESGTSGTKSSKRQNEKLIKHKRGWRWSGIYVAIASGLELLSQSELLLSVMFLTALANYLSTADSAPLTLFQYFIT